MRIHFSFLLGSMSETVTFEYRCKLNETKLWRTLYELQAVYFSGLKKRSSMTLANKILIAAGVHRPLHGEIQHPTLGLL